MRAVLMAGGSGTRLRPLTCDLPKPMVPILNRPIAEHIINLLKRHRITEVIATLHYLPDVMRDYFSDGSDFGVQMTYAVEEDQPLGTAGCVKNIADLLDSTFLVISGDSITDFDLNAAIEFHKKKQSKATLILTRVPNPIEFGVVITDTEGRITYVNEKFTKTTGFQREEVLGKDHRILNSGYHPKEFFRDLWTTIGAGIGRRLIVSAPGFRPKSTISAFWMPGAARVWELNT